MFHWVIVVVLLVGLAEYSNGESKALLVSTSAGNVLGFAKDTRWGKVVQYFGIQYAEIPTGTGRYFPSKPLLGQDSSVNKVDNPTTHHNMRSPPACIQPVHLPEFTHPSIPQGGVQVSEDCLKINVYQPFGIGPMLPIVVFVPGNGYSFADMVQYDGSALAAVGKVIVVTINYRVGAFGFASMGNNTLPGNAGLSDIASALKFIIHNAKAFNGDANLVTLAGRFSGAMAVTTLVTSPLFYTDVEMTKPLAKRVIIHGGAATSDYTIDRNPSDLFNKFATEANCLRGNGQESLLCLQTLETLNLQKISEKFLANWKPVVDGVTLMRNPITSIEFGQFSSDISFLVGDNLDSGSICYDTLKYSKSTVLNDFAVDTLTEDQFKSLASDNIKEFYKLDTSNIMNVTSHEYYYRPSVRGSWRDALLEFCSALYVRNPVELFARYASRLNAIVYRYEFGYRPSTSIYPSYFDGALGDEIILMFPTEKTILDDNDVKVAISLLETWGNFVKTGNPSSKNLTFNELNKTLIGITGDGLKVSSTTTKLDADVHFWRQVLLPLYYNMDCVKKVKQIPKRRNGVMAICMAIIGLSVFITTFIYVVVIRARGRGYKWSW